MKTVVVLTLLLGLAFSAQAVNPMVFTPNEPVDLSFSPRDMDYCQAPDTLWTAINASLGFASELVDDIPQSFECNTVASFDFYVVEWGANWQEPTGIFLNFYNSACPPDLGPDQDTWYAWNGPYMSADLVYDGDSQVWRIHIDPNDQTHIENPMSIGIQVDNGWGEDPPYCGIAVTDGETYGACEGMFDGTYWGYPRWTPLGDGLGYPADMAYCITMETTPTESTSWSSVKNRY